MQKTFGQRLKELRKAKKLTQDKLAEASGVARISIARYESDTMTPSAEVANKIAIALNVSADELLGNSPNSASVASDDDIKFALFGDVSNITDAQFAEVKEFARFIKERAARGNK